MTFKSDVSILELDSHCLLGMWLAEPVYARRGFQLMVTSVYRPGTAELLHAKGRAFDCRVLEVAPQEQWKILTEEIGRTLRPLGFDVILENPENLPYPSQSKVASHIHVEYDPKDAAGNKLLPIT